VTAKEKKQKRKKNSSNLFSLLYLLLERKDWATASAGIRPKLFFLSPLEPPELEKLGHVSILPPAIGTETNGSSKYLTYLSLMGSTLATFTEQNGSRRMPFNSGI
jgi:hypothetical protein